MKKEKYFGMKMVLEGVKVWYKGWSPGTYLGLFQTSVLQLSHYQAPPTIYFKVSLKSQILQTFKTLTNNHLSTCTEPKNHENVCSFIKFLSFFFKKLSYFFFGFVCKNVIKSVIRGCEASRKSISIRARVCSRSWQNHIFFDT